MRDATDTPSDATRDLPNARAEFRPLTRDWAEASIPTRFREQAERTPGALALKTRLVSQTYGEMEKFSNRIAHEILGRGKTDGRAVCLLLEHDANVPAAILGVLKTGKFYVALDVSHPQDRNALVVEDAGADILITNDRHLDLAAALVDAPAQIVNLDRLAPDGNEGAPGIEVAPDDIAYLVYTSGSTGKPKGVVQSHRSALHSTLRQTNGWQTCPDDRIGLFFTYNFGACPPNVFGALLTGAALYPFDVKLESPSALIAWLKREEITFFHIVPTLFRHLVSTLGENDDFPALRLIRLAGETIYGSDVRMFQQNFSAACTLQVGMGSAETGSVFQNCFQRHTACPEGVVPPGYSVEDVEVLLVDDAGEPVAPGEPGEIAVRSRYMFSGYWRRPDLTEKVLTPDPDGGDAPIYYMRDLGMRLPDGRVTHLGRKDTQVKIRGHRVEISEIEIALRAVPGVADAAVVARDNQAGAKQLVAFVVKAEDASMPISLLRKILKDQLPSYLVPAAFVPIDELPQTTSGKVDRGALGARPLPEAERAFEAPRDHLETQLQSIWEDVLGQDGFGIRDDFFDLGGDSLSALKMAMRVEEETGRPVNLASYPTELTIELLADRLEASEQQSWQQAIQEVQASGSAPPIYFCHGAIGSGGFFCRALAKHLGPDQPFFAIPPHGLDGGAFPQTVEAMAADRVEALRAHQPDGPYRLGGFCWGGYIALEMARKLKAQGAEVETLLLIDSDPLDIRAMRPLRGLISRLGRMLRLSERAQSRLFRTCRKLTALWNGPKGAYRVLTYPVKKLIRGSSGAEAEDAAMGMPGAPAGVARRSRWPIYHRIAQDYVPARYPGRIAVFQSSDVRKNYRDDPAASWRHVTADIQVHEIAGDHQTCVARHADDVAGKMRAYL